jgi:hypothetical protein
MNIISSNARIVIVAGPALATTLSEHINVRPDWDCYLAPSLETLPNPESPPPDLLILDALVCADAACRDLDRLCALGCPIILIGGGDKAPPVDALAHLPRPFRLTELLDCVHTALSPPPLAAPSLTPASLRLTEKEQAIFARLALAGGAVVARTQLLSRIWGYGPSVSTRTLETHVGRLRRKLAASDSSWRVLSASGGYRLVDSFSETVEKSGDGERNPLGCASFQWARHDIRRRTG